MLEKTYEGLKTTTLKTSQAFINKGKIIELTKDLEKKHCCRRSSYCCYESLVARLCNVKWSYSRSKRC
jgi:hypothetical protein